MPHSKKTRAVETAHSQDEEIRKEYARENEAANPVVQMLQRQVANALVLYSNYKQYHWATFGPLFRDLHLLFDEFAAAVLPTADEFAERVRMIGQDVAASGLREAVDMASVHAAGTGQSMKEILEEADANLQVIIHEIREGAHIADEENDPGTVDLCSKVVQIHEKHEWFIREILKHGDGLTR